MLIVILAIVTLMAVPEYAVAQERERPGRSVTGRTAVPREEAVQAAPARRTDRRPEPRGETPTRRRQADNEDDVKPSRADRARRPLPSVDRTERQRSPSRITQPGYGHRRFPDREHRPGQGGTDHWLRYRRAVSAPNVMFVPYAAPVVVEREVVVERAPVIIEQPSPARLILDIYPPTAQVFADGYFIGIPEDFRFEAGGAVLEPGPHRIDILARGHEQVSFDVNLTRGQAATYRQVLAPIVRAPQLAPDTPVKAPTAPTQPTTFYLIPGCYMGNVPPKDANLPATCDIARAVSVQY